MHPQTPPKRPRIIGKDAFSQIKRIGFKRAARTDFYHWMMRTSWPVLFATTTFFFFGLNALFALFYLLGGATIENAGLGSFWDAFFFSVQTMATIGYGKMAPIGFYANFLSSIEAYAGLLSLAIFTGLVFAKFSRPTARVLFSKVAIVAPMNKKPCLMFRMANGRTNYVMRAEISLGIVMNELTEEGQKLRRFHDLKLLRSKTQVFGITWLAMHPIEEGSPLFGKTTDDLKKLDAEIVISFSGIDNAFLQTIHTEHSYLPEEIIWNARYKDLFCEDENGQRIIDYRRFDEFELL